MRYTFGAWLPIALCLAFALGAAPSAAHAQPKAKKPAGKRDEKPKIFDFTGLDIAGRMRTPQLLYFLDRANEELDRASLERRSFIPEMVRSIQEEAL